MSNLTGHTNWIFALTLLPNGYLASASGDHNILLWNITRKYPLNTLSGHKNAVRALVVIQNQILASCSFDRTIKLWSLSSYSLVKSLNASTSEIGDLAYDPVLNMIASGEKSPTNLVKLWDMSLWTSKNTFFSKF